MARRNANALRGVSRGKRYRRYEPAQYARIDSHDHGDTLVRVIRSVGKGFLVELPDGNAATVSASEVFL